MTSRIFLVSVIPLLVAVLVHGDALRAAGIPAIGLVLVGIVNNPHGRRTTRAEATVLVLWLITMVVGLGFAVWGTP